MGHSLWWFLGDRGCQCGLQAAGILSNRFVSCDFTYQYGSSVTKHFFLTGATAFQRAAFGPGTDPILLDNVGCSGSETQLVDCSNSGIGVHNCAHSEDAGVRCQRKQFCLPLYCVVVSENFLLLSNKTGSLAACPSLLNRLVARLEDWYLLTVVLHLGS